MPVETKNHDEVRLFSSWGDVLYLYIDYDDQGGFITAPQLDEYHSLLVAERFLRLAKEYLPPHQSVALLHVWAQISKRLDKIEKELGKDPKLPF